MNKKYIAIICIVIMLILISLIYLNKVNSKEKLNLQSNSNNLFKNINCYNSYIINNKSKIIQNFENRYVLVNNSFLYIGNNQKEIENGYYDIKIEADENSYKYIQITINKLFILNTDFYDDNYIFKIVYLINYIFDFDFSVEQIESLKTSIIKNYEYLRKNYVENVDKLNKISISRYTIINSIQKGMLVLKIYEN